MQLPNLPKPTIVDNADALASLVVDLQAQDIVGVDTESNSLYVYHGRICLIQLSTRERDYIVDPLVLDDLGALRGVFRDGAIEKVFHAAEYDLICLKREFDFDVVNVFDTMFAARVLRYPVFGLGDLLLRHFDVPVDKSHQRDDWGVRPLPEDSLHYAQMDTHYLPRLRDCLRDALVAEGSLEEAQEIFKDVERVDAKPQVFDPEGYWKLARPNQLTKREVAILRELYLLRDEIAQIEDVPPYKAIPNRVLLSMATLRPRNLRQLKRLRGFHQRYARLYGVEFLDAIELGLHAPLPVPPSVESPDPVIAERYMTLHAWRKERAIERGVDSNIVISKQALWEIAYLLPRTLEELSAVEGIGAWRLRTYGEEILRVVESFHK